jgi:tRNA 2-thiouridine synthesizing protein E
MALEIAKEEGLSELNEKHWKVIRFMRDDYKSKGQVPTLRRLKNESGVDTKEIYALFPDGPSKKAAKISGLEKPKGCI